MENKAKYQTPTLLIMGCNTCDVLTVSDAYETDVNFTTIWGGALK